MQPAGVMFLDHENRYLARGPAVSVVAERFRRLRLVAFAAVLGQIGDILVRRQRIVQSRQQIPGLGDPLQNLRVQQLPQVRRGQLRPLAGRRRPRSFPAPQRIRGERRLGSAVLTPVDEHAIGAHRLGHRRGDRVRMRRRQPGRDLLGDFTCRIRGDRAVEPGVHVDAFAAAGHRIRAQARGVEHVPDQQRDLRAFG